MSVVTLAAGDSRVEVMPEVGGAIASFTLRAVDVLRPTTPADRAAGNVRAHACYPLVPYSNRIAGALLRFAGQDHPLARNFGESPHAIHGVGWQRPWRVVAQSDASATLEIDHDPARDGASSWPYPFRATQGFALASNGPAALLTMSLAIVNAGSAAFPFGLGWHPFFPKTAGTTLRFTATGMWMNDATQMPQRLAPISAASSFDSPRALAETTLDNVFTGWTGSAHMAWPDRAFAVAIDADRACDRLVVFIPAGRDFLAVEPVTHMTDAFNRHAAGETTTGTRILEPGAAFSCTMRLRAAPQP